MTSSEVRKIFAERCTLATSLTKRLSDVNKSIATVSAALERDVQTKHVILEVAKATQKKFVDQVNNLVNLGIKSVFTDRDFTFNLEFTTDGGRPVGNLVIREGDDEEPFEPKDELGVGLLNVVSVAMRVVLLTMERPLKRRLLILDEPFTALGSEDGMLAKAGAMLRYLSHSLDIQMIINTHSPELTDIADHAWEVTFSGGRSVVTQKKGQTVVKRKAHGHNDAETL